MRNIKRGIAATVMVLGLLAAGNNPVRGATIAYDFTVEVFFGPLSGNTFAGWFSFDDTNLTGVGSEVLDIPNDNLKIEFSFLEKTFDQDDESFEIYIDRTLPVPSVSFLDGVLEGLSYRVDEVRGTHLTPIPDPVQDFTILESGFGYRTWKDDKIFLYGKVTYEQKNVPEPGTLLAIGVLGGGFLLKTKRQ
ncbi:MAG: PEP-CTERM sorting domain-containing protein [Spirulina sp.]